MSPYRQRRTVVPEVVQTSATDCGPACMKSVLEGLGLSLDYRTLREACQTDVDGTSINTLEEIAKQLGLEAEQVMLPLDHVFLAEARALPAIIVTLSPGGRPHFVVLWNRVGPLVQVMDPATGRHWITLRSLASRLYQHTTAIPAAMWREWAGTDEAVAALERRLRDLGAVEPKALVTPALADPLHGSLATLDAATRAVDDLVKAGALRRGPSAAGMVGAMVEQARLGAVAIPEHYGSVRPNPDATGEDDALLLTGAVLLRFRGWRAEAPAGQDAKASPIPEDVANALLRAPEVNPRRTLLRLLAQRIPSAFRS